MKSTKELINRFFNILGKTGKIPSDLLPDSSGGVQSVAAADESIAVNNTDPLNPTVGLPYKVYTALLTQSGTGAPSAIVLENTVGNIVWSRVSAGVYEAYLSNAFPDGKTVCPPFDHDGFVNLPIGASTIFSNAYQLIPWLVDDGNKGSKLRLLCYDAATWDFIELSSVLTPCSLYIEIRVYP